MAFAARAISNDRTSADNDVLERADCNRRNTPELPRVDCGWLAREHLIEDSHHAEPEFRVYDVPGTNELGRREAVCWCQNLGTAGSGGACVGHERHGHEHCHERPIARAGPWCRRLSSRGRGRLAFHRILDIFLRGIERRGVVAAL